MRLSGNRPLRVAASVAITLGCALALLTARPAGAIVYGGDPDLALTVDLVTAGSGDHGFDSRVLFEKMYGTRVAAERQRLLHLYGPMPVDHFFTLMDFTVADVVRMTTRDHVTLPKPDDPLDADALNRKLIAAGQTPAGRFDIGYLIERLMSHHYHHELMSDLNAHFKAKTVGSFHTVLASVVQDTAGASQ